MHLGVFTYDYPPSIGGLGSVSRSIVKEWKAAHPQDNITVFSPSSGSDVQVSRLAALRFGKKGGCPLFSILLNLKIGRLIKKYNIDCAHIHAGSGGVFLLRKPKCPVLVTSHHTYQQEAELVFHNRPFKRFTKYFMSLLERRTYMLADKITCVSRDTADALILLYGIPPSKITIIENGSTSTVLPTPRNPHPATFLYVGRLEERKGIGLLLRAFQYVLKKHPDAELRLAGQNLMGERLHYLLRFHNLAKNVTVLGYVFEPFLQREMASAQAMVVPSVLEGFGLVAADAMNAGLCVISSNCPGLKSLTEPGETGIQFESGNAALLAKGIVQVIEQPEVARQLEAKAQVDAKKRFNWKDRAEDYRALAQGLIQEQNS